MRLYIWTGVERLTDHYHDRGGLVIVARDLDEARQLLAAHYTPTWSIESYGAGLITGTPPELGAPAAEYDVGAVEPAVLLFPNAGCC